MSFVTTGRNCIRLSGCTIARVTTFAALLACVLLAGVLVEPASAGTVPIVFPLEDRVTVNREFQAQRDGHLHQGIDLMAPKMAREVACVSGTVTLQVRTYDGSPWYTLWLAGDDGHGYYYSHINNDTPGTDDELGGLEYAFAPGLRTGDHVDQGQFIAYCGDSGNAEGTAAHLHFQIHETTDMFSASLDPYDSLRTAPLADGTAGLTWPTPTRTRYEQTNSLITYTGSWTGLTVSGASGGSYTYADSTASALIWFQGTSADLLVTMGPQEGMAWLTLDGAPSVPLDLYSPTVLRQQTVFSSGPLAQGTHTIRLDCANQASVPEGGTRVDVDALLVTGILVKAPDITSAEQTNSHLAFTGTWSTVSAASASSGSFASANSEGSSVNAQFEGISVSWIATKSPGYGIAQLTIDDSPPVLVDLYASSTAYRQRVWTSPILPDGVHRLTIQWTGTKRAAATGTAISLDALRLVGGMDGWGEAMWAGPRAGRIIPPSGILPPNITSLSPAAGPISGGTQVVIVGSDFVDLSGPSAVTFGGVDALSYTVDSPTEITAVAPPKGAGTVSVVVTAAGGSTEDSSVDDFIYYPDPVGTRFDATTSDSPLVFSGTWSGLSRSGAYGGNYLRSSTAGAYVVIPFYGTRLDWIAMLGTTTGKADVYLDNMYRTTVDLSAPAPIYGVDVWSTGDIPAGYHTVKILARQDNPAGRFITIDAVDVAGTLVGTARYEQTDARLLWTPSYAAWTTGPSSSYSGGSIKYIDKSGSVTIGFTGVRLNLIAKKSPSYGKAKITLDGATVFTVSLYSSSTVYRQVVWSSGFLAPGDHTVKIQWTGVAGATGGGSNVNMDAADVIGELR